MITRVLIVFIVKVMSTLKGAVNSGDRNSRGGGMQRWRHNALM
jgi:hypothetical protein